jgi:ATP-dependent Lhr-like helicase
MILAGEEVSPRWSRRAQGRLSELREQHSFVHAHGPTLLSRSPAEIEWWTFAGTRANAMLASELARSCDGRVDHDGLAVMIEGAGGLSAVDEAVRELALRDPSSMTPAVDEDALEGLKFAECLPRELGLAVLGARMQDAEAVRGVLSQRLRIVSGA